LGGGAEFPDRVLGPRARRTPAAAGERFAAHARLVTERAPHEHGLAHVSVDRREQRPPTSLGEGAQLDVSEARRSRRALGAEVSVARPRRRLLELVALGAAPGHRDPRERLFGAEVGAAVVRGDREEPRRLEARIPPASLATRGARARRFLTLAGR